MTDSVKVRISRAIANEYEQRAVYDFIGRAGTYNLLREQATELCEDAVHQALDVEYQPPGTARAYSALASNLMAALA